MTRKFYMSFVLVYLKSGQVRLLVIMIDLMQNVSIH